MNIFDGPEQSIVLRRAGTRNSGVEHPAMVRPDDAEVLDTLGVADNTLIVFLGDNGSDAPLGHQHEAACAAPLRDKKGTHYEGGTRVPFIAAWAKANPANPFQKRLPIAVNAMQPQQAAVYDLFPTILALTGARIPGKHVVDGSRLDTLLTGKPDRSRKEQFLMHYPHSPHRTDYFTVWRDGERKVIYHYFPTEVSGGSHYQLFNLKNDPFEQKDLAAIEPGELKRLMQGMVAALEQQHAVYPVERDGQGAVIGRGDHADPQTRRAQREHDCETDHPSAQCQRNSDA